MSDEPDNIVLDLLRQVVGNLDRLGRDMRDFKDRLTALEQQVALLHGDFAGQSVRIDRIELRLERIERLLELVPSQPQI